MTKWMWLWAFAVGVVSGGMISDIVQTASGQAIGPMPTSRWMPREGIEWCSNLFRDQGRQQPKTFCEELRGLNRDTEGMVERYCDGR